MLESVKLKGETGLTGNMHGENKKHTQNSYWKIGNLHIHGWRILKWIFWKGVVKI
jgi:hypothetical protein